MSSDEENPADLTSSDRTQILADVRDSLTTVESAEIDLIDEIFELRNVLSLLTGVASRLEQAGLLLEANSVREHDALLSTQLTESEDRLEVVRSMKRRLRTAEERLAAHPTSPQYGPTAPPSINESRNERAEDGSTAGERRAAFGSPK